MSSSDDFGDSGDRTALATGGIVSAVLIAAMLLVAGSLFAVKKFKVWRRQVIYEHSSHQFQRANIINQHSDVMCY